jgi:putative methyltransferase (TIGR04325 family)
MTLLHKAAKNWLPPAFERWLRRTRNSGNQFRGGFSSWDEASAHCSGYDDESILDHVLQATLKVKNGDAAFERDSVLFDTVEYSWPVLAGLLSAAVRHNGTLCVLDYGGALGSAYYQNRGLLQTLPEFRWNVVEQAHFVEAGRKSIEDEHLRFYFDIAECLAANDPNIILAGSVLQYLASPFHVLDELSGSGADYLLIERTPFSEASQDTVLIQEVPPSIYTASYPMQVFSKQNFMQAVGDKWALVAHIASPEGRVSSSDGFEFEFAGMLMERRR